MRPDSSQVPGTSFRALIFDMDGTLVDNMAYHRRAWLEFLAGHGIRLTEAELEQQNRGIGVEMMRHFFGAVLPLAEAQELLQAKEARYRSLYRPHLQLVAGARAFLEACRAYGLRLALATAGDKPNIDFVLDGLALRPYFDAVVGAEQVRAGKPDPEVFLVAASQLRVAPAHCLVFEDSRSGFAAARAASMACIGLTTSHTAAELHAQNLRRIITDYTALQPHKL